MKFLSGVCCLDRNLPGIVSPFLLCLCDTESSCQPDRDQRVTVVSLSLHSSFCFNASADCIFIMTKPGGGLYLKFLYHYCREASKAPGLMPEIGRYAGRPDNCSLAWGEMIISAF